MGKGSAPRPFTDRAVFESNFDKIFGKKDKTQDPVVKPFPHNILKESVSRIEQIGQNGNDGLHYDKEWGIEMKPVGQEILPEYELNKSTGEVDKVFKESIEQNDDILKTLKDGINKPNESQFNGD